MRLNVGLTEIMIAILIFVSVNWLFKMSLKRNFLYDATIHKNCNFQKSFIIVTKIQESKKIKSNKFMNLNTKENN